MKVKWWQPKWKVVIDGGCRFAEFGPYRCKLVAMWVAATLPGPLETASITRIIEKWSVPGYKPPPSGEIFNKVEINR